MTKVTRREAIGLLLVGSVLLEGCAGIRLKSEPQPAPPENPDFPKTCVWSPLSYDWYCFDKLSESLIKDLGGPHRVVQEFSPALPGGSQ